MNAKMERFLKSIGLKDIERFDLDFEAVARRENNRNICDMIIKKQKPWDFSLLEEFMDGLSTIKYQYTILFEYINPPTINDAINLFDEWHRYHNRFPSSLLLEEDDNKLCFVFNSDQEKVDNESTIKEFKDFLGFLHYQINIKEDVREKCKDEIIDEIDDEEKMLEIEKEALENYKESIEHQKIESNKKTKFYKGNNNWRDNLPYNEIVNLSNITSSSGNIDIKGEVFGVDATKVGKNNKTFLNFGIGNFSGAINAKIIESDLVKVEDIHKIKNHLYIHAKGYVENDRFNNQLIFQVRTFEMIDPPKPRDDNEEQKRVELHLHTKMSCMDGLSTITDYCNLAKHMGHKAIALTDHGVIQAYPEAQDIGGKLGIKILYGSELYMVNDDLPFAPNPSDRELSKASYVVFDLETTGLSSRYDGITEFGAVKFEDGQVVKSLQILINPQMSIPKPIQIKTKITDEMVKNCPTIKEVMPKILDFIGDSILVSHNIVFDVGFLNEKLRVLGKEPLKNPQIDTLSLSRYMFPESRKHTLGALSKNLGITVYNDEDAHRADYDAKILNDVWLAMLHKLTENNPHLKHSDLSSLKVNSLMYKHMRPAHIVALCKNKQGLHDLYNLISDSHTKFLADVPKTPKSELASLRSNLLLGSACFNGEVFDTARTRSKDILKQVISFYDYIEVQPPENYIYLINNGNVKDLDTIKKYIKDIIEAAEELGKIIVATGDVHYLNPEDKPFRDVFIAAKGVGGRPHPLFLYDSNAEAPNQHYRSTKEMLDAFEFLGKEKAFEIVVKNTNVIADMIEELKPIQKTLHPPVIEDSPKILKEVTESKAKELYGDPLPELVQTRLEKELNGIIGNGYSVTYYIARRIVQEANSKGFMVGSRGSVGSSFAAHMFGITEVNPLPPHYRCPKCKHLEFISDPNCLSGYDLDDKKCPICGEKMVQDGQNIPFETFLGFKGDKIPDIDLNFPSDYQSKAFDYTKVVFGEHNVFRAGTIETVADKTAFGYVRGYFERHGKNPNDIPSSYIGYLASHCTDVKRTTGQHPGGIMVLPKGLSIYDFTPIQYPADDKTSTWFTTHLDYTALHDALLKLDLLGHVDPLALRLMSDLTHVDVKTIPLNDKKVISLFSTDKALERTSNYLKVKTGATGLPEFGTDTGQDILIDAKPKSFADLVIIAGLAHGTNVWAHNAQDLIRNGTCSVREVIGCRDDIMTFLIKKGLPSDIAFKIMEDVRKGRKLKPEYEVIMKEHNIPQWYLDSCNKIEYMFPKAHAVAYVTMAVRVGYFKIYYPLEFYAVWFSARCKAYDINAMLGGLNSIIARYEEIKRKKANRTEKISPKEKDIFNMLKIAIEMHERGYKFSNIDLYKSEATTFVVDHENKSLIPPFIVLDGLGDSAAISVVEARKEGKFKTKEDLLKRTKLNSTNVDDLSSLGVLDGLGEKDQMSLFDFGFEL